MTVVTGRSADAGQEIVDELVAEGATAIYVGSDLTDDESCKALVAPTIAEFGKLGVRTAGRLRILDGEDGKGGPRPQADAMAQELDIKTNIVAPMAYTGPSHEANHERFGDLMEPENVAAAVAWLASPNCHVSGARLRAGGTYVGRIHLLMTNGWASGVHPLTPEEGNGAPRRDRRPRGRLDAPERGRGHRPDVPGRGSHPAAPRERVAAGAPRQ